MSSMTSARQAPPSGFVTISIRISRETFELLQDVALAHVIDGVAEAASAEGQGRALAQPSVSAVVETVIDRHRQFLEQEAETVRGRKGS